MRGVELGIRMLVALLAGATTARTIPGLSQSRAWWVGWWCLGGEGDREMRMVVGAWVRDAGNFWRGRSGNRRARLESRLYPGTGYHATGTQDAETG